MKWCILLPAPDIGGGSYVVLRHALAALAAGIEVTVVTDTPVHTEDLAWLPEAAQLRFSSYEAEASSRYDVAIATFWMTAYKLPKINAARYLYFVQSIESRFYPKEETPLRLLAEASYSLPLTCITEAGWIQRYLRDHFAKEATLARNGIDKEIFRLEGAAFAPRQPGRFRLLAEGPLEAPYKNVAKAIQLCRKAGADEVWLLTSSAVDHCPGVDRVFSRIPLAKTAEVYRSCDAIVKLSYVEGMYGPPLEMFHCGGTAVTYAVSGHEEYIENGVNALVAGIDDEDAVVAALRRMKKDASLLQELKHGALQTAAAWPGWPAASSVFVKAVEAMASESPPASQRELAAAAGALQSLFDAAQHYRMAPTAMPTPKKGAKAWTRRHFPRLYALLGRGRRAPGAPAGGGTH